MYNTHLLKNLGNTECDFYFMYSKDTLFDLFYILFHLLLLRTKYIENTHRVIILLVYISQNLLKSAGL